MTARQLFPGLALLTVLAAAPVAANDAVCPDAELLSGKRITDICWRCLFPVRVLGVDIAGGERPSKSTDKVVCSCKDNQGVPEPGLVVGMWEPARIIELVRSPTCAPALGGIRLPLGNRRLLGTDGRTNADDSEVAFYNYHIYAFPLLVLLDLFLEDRCNPDGFSDMDVLYFSELDPTWNDSELGFFANPEAAWLGSPTAKAACMADAAAATAGKPIDELFWCAGTWGGLYPFCGAQTTIGGNLRYTSLSAARAMAVLHRRGLARGTVGDDALCKAPITPFMPKGQYKLSMFYPSPETERAHKIGESTFTWGINSHGTGRSYPGPGEDNLYLLWRWQDCCVTY